jgi:formamidopyrimidine-DNA glycosylase
MPELPEVETTRRGIAGAVTGQTITNVTIRDRRLRWRIPADFETSVAGRRILSVERRAKYLLLRTDGGTLLIHLGMSGSLRVLAGESPARLHDHVELGLGNGMLLRFNDPRRFGSFHFVTGEVAEHPLLASLGPEPLAEDFTGELLFRRSRRRRVAVKQFIMDSHVVVGVGNIYASEALFRAGIRPGRGAGRLSRDDCRRLAEAIRAVLASAIDSGGTTLRDYVNAEGLPGYFRQRLFVYERRDEPCRRCASAIRARVQGGRATYWCPNCQA